MGRLDPLEAAPAPLPATRGEIFEFSARTVVPAYAARVPSSPRHHVGVLVVMSTAGLLAATSLFMVGASVLLHMP